MKYKIKYYKGITNTPAQLYALNAHMELFNAGLTDGTSNPPAWDDNAIVAFEKYGEPIGIITWAKSEWCKTISVRLGYVSSGYRRENIYKGLWNELVKIAINDSIVYIDGATGYNNKIMQSVMKSLKRKPISISYRFQVTKP